MQRYHLKEKIGAVDDIPPLPAIATRIIDGCINEQVNNNQLADFYSLDDHIDDLSHAISLLGRKTIRNLVLSISIYNTFTPEGVSFLAT